MGLAFLSYAAKAETNENPFDYAANFCMNDEYKIINDSSFIYTQLICQTIDQIKETLVTSDTLQANELHLQTSRLLDEYLYAIESLEKNWVRSYGYIEKENLPAKAGQLVKQMEECSIEIRYIGGGESELTYNQYLYRDLFKNYVSKDFADFIEITARQAGVFSADAAIVISWEEIGSYIMDWETFIKSYPSSIFKEEAIESYYRYMYSFLFGDVNSPVIDIDNSGIIKADIRLAFNDFLIKYTDSNSAKILTYYLEEIKNNDGKPAEDLQNKIGKLMENLTKK